MIKIITTDLKCKIMDYRMDLTFMLYYPHSNFINMPIWNKIMNIINPL